jgi:hypothetical protein
MQELLKHIPVGRIQVALLTRHALTGESSKSMHSFFWKINSLVQLSAELDECHWVDRYSNLFLLKAT